MDGWNIYKIGFSYRKEWIGSTLIDALTLQGNAANPEEYQQAVTDRLAEISYQLMFKLAPIDGSLMMIAEITSEASKPGASKRFLQELRTELNSHPLALKQIRDFLEIANTVGASGEALQTLGNFLAEQESTSLGISSTKR